jgi:hypothetical protein
MNGIVCPLRLFRELLLVAHRGEQATVRVGAQRTADGVRWLFRSPLAIEGALVRESAGPGRVRASQPAGDNDHRAPRFFVTGVGAGMSRLMPFIAPPLCCGGLSDQRRAVEDICLPESGRPPQDRFGDARRGSLRSLNMLAVSIGIHMLQAAVAGHFESSRWTRLRAHPSGEVAMSYPELYRVPGCSLCLRAGIGDAAGLGLPGGSTRGAASAP